MDSAIESEEIQYDSKLRPANFDDYVGQEKIKENLKIFISAARMRGDALDHVLFYGPPGLGKTTLANIISVEMGANLKSTSGPVIEKTGDLAALLTNLKEGDILFIDEIHRLSNVIEEVLYSAMEDFKLDIMIGQGPSARSSIPLARPSTRSRYFANAWAMISTSSIFRTRTRPIAPSPQTPRTFST